VRTTYYDEDDILVLHLSDKPVYREISQDWNTHISYAEDGTTVEIVLLDAKANGAYPSGAGSLKPVDEVIVKYGE
jgi:hypothetical protein